MAGQEDPVQREIHQDWANREYIEVITSSIKKIADFLNSFGQRASRGRRDGGRILRQLGGGAERLRRDSLGALVSCRFSFPLQAPPSSSFLDPQAALGSPCKVVLLQAELYGLIAITPDPLTSSFFQTRQAAPSTLCCFASLRCSPCFLCAQLPFQFSCFALRARLPDASLNWAVLLPCLKTLEWTLSPSESSRNPTAPCFLVPPSPLSCSSLPVFRFAMMRVVGDKVRQR